MHPLLAAAAFAIHGYQVPPDTVPAFKLQRPVLGRPVNVDPAQRQRLTLEAMSDGRYARVRELCQATGLRPGAQRRTLRALIRQGRVEFGGRSWPKGPKNAHYRAVGVR